MALVLQILLTHLGQCIEMNEFSSFCWGEKPTVMRFQSSERMAADALTSDLAAAKTAILVGGVVRR